MAAAWLIYMRSPYSGYFNAFMISYAPPGLTSSSGVFSVPCRILRAPKLASLRKPQAFGTFDLLVDLLGPINNTVGQLDIRHLQILNC